MTNDNLSTPNIAEPLQRIDATSKGAVSRPTWDASAGKSRADQIKEAREQAYKDYQAQQVAQTPAEIRLLKMEGAIAQLQQEIKQLKENK